MRRCISPIVVASIVTATAIASSQSAEIAGVVQDGKRQPIARAVVHLADDKGQALGSQVTDETGRFRFTGVPPGHVRMTAVRAGYTSFESNGPPVLTVGAGERIESLLITLRKGGVISGTIRDQFGDPTRAVIFAIPRFGPDGQRSSSVYARTDERGRYRIIGLAPGEYLVSAGFDGAFTTRDPSGQERGVVLPETFYPGVTTRTLATYVVVAGENEVPGIDLQLMPVSATTVSVTIHAPFALSMPQLTLRGDDAAGSRVASRPVRSNVYEIHGVVAGRYRLVVNASEPAVAKPVKWWGQLDVISDGVTPSAVTVQLERGVRVAGRVVIDGTAPEPRVFPRLIGLTRNRIDDLASMPATSMIDSKGGFTIDVPGPGTYVLAAESSDLEGRWALQSATARGRDILDLPITFESGSDWDDVVLTITNQLAEINGTITTADGAPLAGVSLVAFSTIPPHWYETSRRIRVAQPDAQGRYVIRNLPAGDYWLAAVGGVPQFPQGLTAGFTELSAAAVRISLKDGEKKRQDLRGSGR